MGSYWGKYILFELKRNTGITAHETEDGYKIWRLIEVSFQNWQKKFDKFWHEHLKVFKIFILIGSFRAKYILFELKKCRGVIFHETEEEYKIWTGMDLPFQNWHKKFDKFWPEHLKVSKIFISLSSFWGKYILFELKKCRGIIFLETEEGYKIWSRINLSFQNWYKEFDKT